MQANGAELHVWQAAPFLPQLKLLLPLIQVVMKVLRSMPQQPVGQVVELQGPLKVPPPVPPPPAPPPPPPPAPDAQTPL